ncbi:MAG: polysaccharide deacetylase family protein, partial [Paracoccaceae bacterium]
MVERQIGLIFHGIGAPDRELERGEAPYWVSITQFEDTLDMIRAHPQPGRFRISFDDGNMSDHDIALPRLVAAGLVAEFFVLSGR